MKYDKLLIALFSVMIGFLVGSIIISIIGIGNPDIGFLTLISSFYEATIEGLVSSASLYNAGEWFMRSSVLLLTGVSIAFAYRVRIFNIGAEGQFLVAALTSSVVGAYVQLPGASLAIFALFCGILAGALYGLIPGILKAYFNVSEVVVTIMLNWIAFYYTTYLVNDFFTGNIVTQTPAIQDNASIASPWLSSLFDNANMHLGFIVALIALFVYYILLNKTTYGYELKAVGFNSSVALRSGMTPKRKIISTLVISGAFAGAGGAIYSLGATSYFTASGSFLNYGFDGITVAFLGQMSSIGMFFSALLLGGFRITGNIFTEVPKEIIDVIVGIILISSVLGPKIYSKYKKKGGE